MNATTVPSSRLVCLVVFAGRTLLSATELFVATNGSDNNPGSRPKPFVTLERARDEIRKLKQDRKLAEGSVTIWLRGGDYFCTNALELTAADSGTTDNPIVL